MTTCSSGWYHLLWGTIAYTLRICLPLIIVVACNSDTIAPRNEHAELLWSSLNMRAVTLSTVAPHRTAQLAVTAYNGMGDILPDVDVTFSSSSNDITVTPDGLVTAIRAVPTSSLVLVKVQRNGITILDSAYIKVTDAVDPPPVMSLSINAPPIAAGTTVALSWTVTDAEGNVLTVPVSFRSSNQTVAVVDVDGNVRGNIPDQPVIIRASTTVYGVTLTDSLELVVGYPSLIGVGITSQEIPGQEARYTFSLTDIYISAGGVINFFNGYAGNQPNYAFLLDISFDDPTAAVAGPPSLIPTGDGNIAPFGATSPMDALSAFQRRAFPRPGTYEFYSERLQSGGRIHVR